MNRRIVQCAAVTLSIALTNACTSSTNDSRAETSVETPAAPDPLPPTTWCDTAIELRLLLGDFVDEATFDLMRASISRSAEAAPPAISADLDAILESWDRARDPAEAAGWDPGGIDPSAIETIEADLDIEAAGERLDAFGERECGIPIDGDLPDELLDSPGAASAIGAALGVDVTVARCLLDAGGADMAQPDPADVESAAATCALDLASAERLVDVVATGFDTTDDQAKCVLRELGFDLEAAPVGELVDGFLSCGVDGDVPFLTPLADELDIDREQALCVIDQFEEANYDLKVERFGPAIVDPALRACGAPGLGTSTSD